MTGLVWFRRDLRVHDHPALAAALAEKATELTQHGLGWLLLSHGKPSRGVGRFLHIHDWPCLPRNPGISKLDMKEAL